MSLPHTPKNKQNSKVTTNKQKPVLTLLGLALCRQTLALESTGLHGEDWVGGGQAYFRSWLHRLQF